jgi:photosystem II stability/assembly factor-like uncharacterized protein
MILRPRSIFVALLFYAVTFTSADATWKKVSQFTFTHFGRVSACYFFNADTGLIAFHTENQDFKVLRTTDGGVTWNAVVTPVIGTGGGFVWFNEFWFKNKLEGWAAFKATGTSVGGGVWHTTDGGLNWTQTACSNESMTVWETSSALIVAGNTTGINFSTNGGNSFDIPIASKRNALAFADAQRGVCSGYDTSYLGFMTTTDGGLNWGGSVTKIRNECWGMYALKQGTGTFVCVDENGYTSGVQSTVYRSDNYGKAWHTEALLPIQIMGDIVGEDSMLYVQNTGYLSGTPSGLFRSTDLGQTWTPIGGPNQSFDARIGLAPNTCGQVIYSFDSTGGVWKTTDGGDGFVPGGPGTLTITPASLFDLDTVYCGDTLIRTIDIQRAGCGAPVPTSYTLAGVDAQNYRVTTDTAVHVSFIPQQSGQSSATLVISISDGSSRSIQLSGVLQAVHPPLSIITADQATDSIGGGVNVPFTPKGLHKPTDITVILHYAGDLDYLGSFDAANHQLDMPNEQWSGRSKLYIANARPDVIAGYSKFNVFTDSSFQPTVTYDSLNVVSNAICSYDFKGPAVCMLEGPTNCGNIFLSRLLRTNSILVNIWPNPTTNDVHISSQQNYGDVRVIIHNALGATISDEHIAIQRDRDIHLSLPQTSGLYEIELVTGSERANYRIIHN